MMAKKAPLVAPSCESGHFPGRNGPIHGLPQTTR